MYDVIIVGSGSAGGVLAARLSEDRARRVLLLEAGPDDTAFRGPQHMWGWADERGPLPRGRILGGCSAVNAAIALRAPAADHDAWAGTWGIRGWGSEELAPRYRAVARRVPVRRPAESELSPLSRAFLDAAGALGHKPVEDHDAPGTVGAGPVPLNETGGVRQSTALCYLAEARTRPNLTVRTGALVADVLLDGRRATGVRLAGGEVIRADVTVLAAGAYATPALLLRSGIGAPATLRAASVDVAHELPGVGRRLQDHPLLALRLYGPAGITAPMFQTLLTLGESHVPEQHVLVGAPPPAPGWGPDADGNLPFVVSTGLLRPRSRGEVRLYSADPAEQPHIRLGLLTDPADVPGLRTGLREALRLVHAAPLRDLVRGGLDALPSPEAGDEVLDRWAAARVSTYHHPVGTCAMGRSPEQGAVVDERCAVHGLDGLRVVDASVFPEVPSVNTNLPVMAVAEHAATLI
jgi:choline dehydrogenase